MATAEAATIVAETNGALLSNNTSAVGPSSSQDRTLTIVVLGASGDLARKKTFPALFNLYEQGYLLGNQVSIVGYARTGLSDEDFKARLRGHLKPHGSKPNAVEDFFSLVQYVAGAYEGEEGFKSLSSVISSIEKEKQREKGEGGREENARPTRRLFYLALPPSVYPPVLKNLKCHVMNPNGWTRVVVEKPFGKDLESAETLSAEVGALFSEEQIYRIDHYLGKEVVQNLLVMRFANRFFVPLWNRDNIDNVQIVFKEDFGTMGRGGYFDEFGIIRDIIQNHLMQVLCLVAMEKPVTSSAEDIRDEKVKVLRAVQPIRDEHVVVGQYEGYLDDPTVPNGSRTPTFATLVLFIKNERWDGIPFIIKAGKSLDNRKAEIRVQFKDVPGDIYNTGSGSRDEFVMRLQPSEAMYIKLTVKKPGLEMAAAQSELDLSYRQRYSGIKIPEAYERLILDVIRGDQQHFVRRDELKAAWEIFTPLLKRVEGGQVPLHSYKEGTRGPPQSDQLAERVGYVRPRGYVWIPPSLELFQ